MPTFHRPALDLIASALDSLISKLGSLFDGNYANTIAGLQSRLERIQAARIAALTAIAERLKALVDMIMPELDPAFEAQARKALPPR